MKPAQPGLLARIRAQIASGLALVINGPAGKPRSKWICRITRDGGKTWRYWPEAP